MKKIVYSSLFLVVNILSISAQWSDGNPMSYSRSSHVSCVLNDGKIFVAGGYGQGSHQKTAEIYDFSTGNWTVTQNDMVSEHTTGTATLLNDGTVLVIGGYNGSLNTSTCEKYNPTNDSWQTMSVLVNGRSDHSATKLQNGKVLVVGGYDGSTNLASCELYDPNLDTWTAAASLTTGRSSHTATLLNDGRVLVTGGYNPNANFQVISTEIYSPSNNTWSAGPDMSVGRNQHAASILSNGKVIISGGESFTGGSPFAYDGLTSVELYDPTNNSFSSLAALPSGLCFHKQITFGEYVMAVGGKENTDYLNGNFTSAAGVTYLYDVTNNSWIATPMNLDGKIYFTAHLSNNQIIVLGGESNGVEIYNTHLGTEKLKQEDLFSIYPNPTENQLNVNFTQTTNVFSYKILDLSGKLIASELTTTQKQVDISKLETGTYFLEIKLNENVYVKKFSKN